MGSGATTRKKILEAAYRLFYRDGFARVGVEEIAAAAGVTKRTLYYHFSSKDELLGAVLDLQHELSLARIRSWSGPEAAEPRAMVTQLFEALGDWMAEPGWQGSGFTRAALELAGLPGHPARTAARVHKAAVENWLAESLARGGLADAEETARQVMLLIEGCQVMTLMRGDPAYAEAARAAALELVGDGTAPVTRPGAGPT